MKSFSFGSGFRFHDISDLNSFQNASEGPENEFLDPELEEIRIQLRTSVRNFWSLLFTYAHQVGNHPNDGIYKVPQAHELREPASWAGIVDRINEAADSVVNDYEKLVRKCRATLG